MWEPNKEPERIAFLQKWCGVARTVYPPSQFVYEALSVLGSSQISYLLSEEFALIKDVPGI
jgi:hypothetical protein